MRLMIVAALLLLTGPAVAQTPQHRTLHEAAGMFSKLTYAFTAAEQCNLRDNNWWARVSARMTDVQVSLGRRFPDALPGGAPAAQAYLMGAGTSASILAGMNVGWAEQETCQWVSRSRELRQLDEMAGRR